MKSFALLILILLLAQGVKAVEPNPNQPSSVEERRIRTAIEEQYNRFQLEGDQLKVEQMQLKTLQKEVDKKLVQMQNLRDELSRLLNRKQLEEGKRVAELGKIYEKMKEAFDEKKHADLKKRSLQDFYTDLPEGESNTDLGLYYLSYLSEACEKVNVKFESFVNQISGSDLTVVTMAINL